MDISDKHVLVTGGSKGVGAALVSELLARSARVTIAARPSEALDRLAALPGVKAMAVDLSDFDALDGYVSRVEAEAGPLDVVINNAALVRSGWIGDLERSSLQAQIAANLLAPMELCRQVLPGMIARGGGIVVNVSSVVAEISIPNLPAYVAAKAGLSKFTLDLQGDLRRMKTPVRAALVILGEIPGTQINTGFREDRTVAGLADKFAKLPVLTTAGVARQMIDLMANPRRSQLVLPRYNAPLVSLRQLPMRLTGRLAG